MSARRIVGLVLVIVGIVALTLGRISWTRDKKVLDTGPLEVTTQEHKSLRLPPVLGVVSLVGGIVLLALPERRRV